MKRETDGYSKSLLSFEHSQKASMRSSTKSENNNSDNMNNNSIEVDDNRSGDGIIDITSTDDISSKHIQQENCESELTQRTEHADNDKSAKVNVYEQVSVN